jgi:hypothetical protein
VTAWFNKSSDTFGGRGLCARAGVATAKAMNTETISDFTHPRDRASLRNARLFCGAQPLEPRSTGPDHCDMIVKGNAGFAICRPERSFRHPKPRHMISPISGYTAKSVGLAIFLFGESLFAQVAVPPHEVKDQSTIAAHTVFEETGGVLAVEAEHFHRQTETSPRAFYVISDQRGVAVTPDADQPHLSGASGGAYVECLPDERVTHADPLVPGRNFSNEGGGMVPRFFDRHGR